MIKSSWNRRNSLQSGCSSTSFGKTGDITASHPVVASPVWSVRALHFSFRKPLLSRSSPADVCCWYRKYLLRPRCVRPWCLLSEYLIIEMFNLNIQRTSNEDVKRLFFTQVFIKIVCVVKIVTSIGCLVDIPISLLNLCRLYNFHWLM